MFAAEDGAAEAAVAAAVAGGVVGRLKRPRSGTGVCCHGSPVAQAD